MRPEKGVSQIKFYSIDSFEAINSSMSNKEPSPLRREWQ